MAGDVARLPLIRFTTEDFPEADRYPAWQSAMSPLFRTVRPPSDRPFHGTAFTVHLGKVAFGGTDVDPLGYIRDEAKIRADMVDNYLIRLGFTEADPSGQLRVIDLGQPIELAIAPMHCLCMFLPRDLVDGNMTGIATLHGKALESARSSMFADYLKSLARSLPELGVEDAPATVEATIALLRSSLAPSPDADSEARTLIEATRLGKARRAIDAHLTSPQLGPELLMNELGMSRANLYRLFRPLGGVQNFIQTRRLQRIHDLLASPGDTRQISELALGHGFPSEAAFSRAFRRMFGYTASEAREIGARQRLFTLAGGSSEDLQLSPPQRMLMWGEWMNRLAN